MLQSLTDPKDAKWPEGLKDILERLGAKSLLEAVRKKVATKPEPMVHRRPPPRRPYKVDEDEIPD